MNEFELDYEETTGRANPKERYRIYKRHHMGGDPELLATCASEEDVGVAVCTLGREGQLDNGLLGLLDSQGEKGRRWLVLPFFPKV